MGQVHVTQVSLDSSDALLLYSRETRSLYFNLLNSPTQVQPKDSLAGVALKYGINLADLRRANQLWTSDTIHLRKVLYIPVDKTRQATNLRAAIIDLTLHPSSTSHSTNTDPSSPQPNGTASATHSDLPDIGKLTLRRVPASQLSYFPPSNHPPNTDDGLTPAFQAAATLPNGRSSRGRPALPVSFTRSKESPLQGVLDIFSSSLQTTANQLRQTSGTLFGNASAVRAPATLASRLSLESNSGTPSTTSDDIDWEHELDIVNSSKSARSRGAADADRSSKRTHAREASASLNDLHSSPSSIREERDSVELDAGPFQNATRSQSPHTPTHSRNGASRSRSHSQQPVTPPSSSRGRGRGVVPYTDTEPPPEWGSPRGKSAVRTAQLEPSPGMQLPLKPKAVAKPRGT